MDDKSHGNKQEVDEVVVVTVRLIRSFRHRNIRNLVLHLPTTCTVGRLLQLAKERASTDTSLPPPFRTFAYDALKVEHRAHGAKTSDPAINTEDDDRLLLTDMAASLASAGVENETSVSVFKMQDYLEYKRNPSVEW